MPVDLGSGVMLAPLSCCVLPATLGGCQKYFSGAGFENPLNLPKSWSSGILMRILQKQSKPEELFCYSGSSMDMICVYNIVLR